MFVRGWASADSIRLCLPGGDLGSTRGVGADVTGTLLDLLNLTGDIISNLDGDGVLVDGHNVKGREVINSLSLEEVDAGLEGEATRTDFGEVVELAN